MALERLAKNPAENTIDDNYDRTNYEEFHESKKCVLHDAARVGTKKLMPFAWSMKRARQSAFTVLEFFNREPFFGLPQFLRDKFGFHLAGMTLPV